MTSRAMRSGALAAIVEFEARLDGELPGERLEGRLPPALLATATAWSDAVWREAVRLGPVDLEPDVRARAATIAQQPVFICGVHRSGTTLVRDLLDGHPALAVLPSEGNFFTNLETQLAGLPTDQARERFGLIWIRRSGNPINQPPYWLLGRSTADGSPYVEFARTFVAFWRALEPVVGPHVTSWPTAAVALAFSYVQARGVLDARLAWWVEKTPTNEQYLDRLWGEFPAALVVHVLRDPLAVVASRKRLEQRAAGSFGNRRAVLRDLARSYEIAVARSMEGDERRYLLLRYEDLTRAPDAAIDRLASFLGIDRTAGLLCPSVAGKRSPSNTSFEPGPVRGRIEAHDRRGAGLTPFERDSVIAVCGQRAGTLGYDVPSLPAWRRRLLKGLWSLWIRRPTR